MNGYFINALIHSSTENQLCPDFTISVCLNSSDSENQMAEHVLSKPGKCLSYGQ